MRVRSPGINARLEPGRGRRLGQWPSETGRGTLYGVTFGRLYRRLDREGEQWKSRDMRPPSGWAPGRDDLLVLAKVADRAHCWIVENSQ